jgi:aspartyl protease family protein
MSALRAARLSAAGLLCALAAATAQATTVMVMSLEIDRAQFLVNGSVVRVLRGGQTSPEGVRLVSADRDQAVVEVDGTQMTLRLGQSTVAVAELKVDPRGQFITTAHINGIETRAMIDTGATSVALSSDEARRLGVGYAGLGRVQIATAGGLKSAFRVNLATVRVGGVTLHNVDAVVMEGGQEQLPITLIGMTFLNGVDMRRVGDTLTLTRRNF